MARVMTDHDHITIELKGTFDVAVARNRLRQLGDRHRLSTMLRARTSAAITTVAEMALFKASERTTKLQLTMVVLNEDGKNPGIALQFVAPFTNDIFVNYSYAQWQLERACDEIEIDNRGKFDFVTMFLWSKRNRDTPEREASF